VVPAPPGTRQDRLGPHLVLGLQPGPSDPDPIKTITDRRTAIAAFDSVHGHPVTPSVPPDAVTASGSGLDPYTSRDRDRAYPVAPCTPLHPNLPR
jgi:K+-transporting ATPase ATPase C chain